MTAATVGPGELWGIVAPNRMRRLALVTDVHGAFATIMLTHPYDEYGSEYDAWFPAGVLRPYPVWVQTDVRGVIFADQCLERLSVLDDAHLAHVATVAAGAPGDGRRLVGPDDPGWHFKVTEGDVVRAFAGAATVAALGEDW